MPTRPRTQDKIGLQVVALLSNLLAATIIAMRDSSKKVKAWPFVCARRGDEVYPDAVK